MWAGTVFLSKSLANMEGCISKMSSHGWQSVLVFHLSPLLTGLPEEELLLFPCDTQALMAEEQVSASPYCFSVLQSVLTQNE